MHILTIKVSDDLLQALDELAAQAHQTCSGVVRYEQWGAVRQLFERCGNVSASLADACLLRMSELRDFQIYRRHGRRMVPVISPWN